MRVLIEFHGPFRVATGLARDGLDESGERGDLLPSSSLKGVMRASAEELLPRRTDLVGAVFGAKRTPSCWQWGSVRFGTLGEAGFVPGQPSTRPRARVAINPATGAALHEHVVFGEDVWAEAAEFTVTRLGPLPDGPGGHDPAEADHLTVLACAAAGVHALGSDRRRGLGWVTLTPREPGVEDVLDRFEELRDARPAG